MNAVRSGARVDRLPGRPRTAARGQLRNVADQVLVAVFTTVVAVLTAAGHSARRPRR